MNYEDRTDLLAPEQAVSPDILSALRLSEVEADRLIHQALDDAQAGASVGSAAYEAMHLRTLADTAPARALLQRLVR